LEVQHADKILEVVHALYDWNVEDLLKLQGVLESMIQARKEGKYSVLEFEGIGKGVWDSEGGVDEFLRRERESWEREETEPGLYLLDISGLREQIVGRDIEEEE